MLSPGDTKPGQDRADQVDNLFRTLSRLVPNAGIQFIDIQISRLAIDGVVRSFSEQKFDLGAGAIWALTPAKASEDGLPVTDDSVLRVVGRDVVQAVIDRWIPLPLLRFVARDGAGRARFDQGPVNWARLFISGRPGTDVDHVPAVIAIDTRTEHTSRLDLPAYVQPTNDDVRFGSTFAMPDDAEELASFLAEPWLQDWVGGTFPLLRPARPGGAPQTAGLQQIASYLTLLSVLRRAGVVPSLQFFDTTRDAVEPVAVDVVLDIGTSRSAALLVEHAGGRPDLSKARLLDLRDLSDPTRHHHGAFDSRIAFARATFGSETLSRRSGRADAFAWPSLARTGPEAAMFAARSLATDGATGVTEPKAHLRDTVQRADTWRFAPDGRSSTKRGQMISGRILAQASQAAGLLPGPAGAVKSVALRPRHALTSLTSFLIAEVVQQALSAINTPAIAGLDTDRGDQVRILRQIILPVPLTMPLDERDMLRERAEAAVDMVWHALDWDLPGDAGSNQLPAKPVVRLGLDETLAAQLVYLYDEIAHRFRGNARALLDVMGKSRPEFGVQPCLRFGAIDVGGGHSTMTIVTYAQNGEAPIGPNLLGAQRSAIAGGTLLDAIAATLLLPAIADTVAAQGGERPLPFLEQMLAPTPGKPHDPTALTNRLADHWLRPAALTLLQLTSGLAAHAQSQTLTLTLGDLVAAQGPLNAAVAAEFSVALEAIRARDVDLAAVIVTARIAEINAATRAALEPMVASLSRALVASDCDAVLLTGWAARLAPVRALLIEQMPWRPDRIIVLADHQWQAWYPMSEADRQAAGGKDVALVGALLALAGGDRLGFGADGTFGFGSDLGAGAATEGWRAATQAPGGAS